MAVAFHDPCVRKRTTSVATSDQPAAGRRGIGMPRPQESRRRWRTTASARRCTSQGACCSRRRRAIASVRHRPVPRPPERSSAPGRPRDRNGRNAIASSHATAAIAPPRRQSPPRPPGGRFLCDPGRGSSTPSEERRPGTGFRVLGGEQESRHPRRNAWFSSAARAPVASIGCISALASTGSSNYAIGDRLSAERRSRAGERVSMTECAGVVNSESGRSFAESPRTWPLANADG
jgi:hypothetical protein